MIGVEEKCEQGTEAMKDVRRERGCTEVTGQDGVPDLGGKECPMLWTAVKEELCDNVRQVTRARELEAMGHGLAHLSRALRLEMRLERFMKRGHDAGVRRESDQWVTRGVLNNSGGPREYWRGCFDRAREVAKEERHPTTVSWR